MRGIERHGTDGGRSLEIGKSLPGLATVAGAVGTGIGRADEDYVRITRVDGDGVDASGLVAAQGVEQRSGADIGPQFGGDLIGRIGSGGRDASFEGDGA